MEYLWLIQMIFFYSQSAQSTESQHSGSLIRSNSVKDSEAAKIVTGEKLIEVEKTETGSVSIKPWKIPFSVFYIYVFIYYFKYLIWTFFMQVSKNLNLKERLG